LLATVDLIQAAATTTTTTTTTPPHSFLWRSSSSIYKL
jgi:hypothetical protein